MVKHKRTVLIVILVMIAATAVGSFIISGNVARQPAITVEQGELDLTKWDYEHTKVIMLAGQWSFYWQQLLAGHDFSGNAPMPNAMYANVPSVWNQYEIDGRSLPGYGYATYRLRVKTDGNLPNLALKIPIMSTAYNIMINRESVAVNGKVAEDRERAEAAYKPQSITFQPPAEDFDIIVQISNYIYARGGMWFAIELGTEEGIASRNKEQFAVSMFIVGSTFMIGLYHIIVFLLRRNNRSALYFGLICLVVVFRTLAMKDMFLLHLLPDLSIRTLVFIEYMTYYGGMTLTAMFIRELYPEEFSHKVNRGMTIVSCLFMLSVIATPLEWYTRWTNMYHLFILASCLYYLYGLMLAVKRKRSGAMLQVVGAIILMSAMFHDILLLEYPNSYHWLGRQYFLIGVFALIVIEATELARRFSHAFSTVETLSEKLLSLDRMKDEFLANTSHELRTPLHGIINLSQSVLERASDRLNTAEKHNVGTIISVSRRLSNLINDILDMSKMKNGTLALRRTEVELGPLVQVVLDMFRFLAGDKDIRLVSGLPARPTWIYADEDRVLQIMYNLVGNALKFTKSGEIRVEAYERGGMAVIAVHDTGIGIVGSKLHSIFDSYEQGDASYGGTGLGLSVSKQLVELHGGTIRASSQVNKGSVFTFTIPLARQKDEQSAAGAQMERVEEPAEYPPDMREAAAGRMEILPQDVLLSKDENAYTILVADDDPVNRQVLHHLLTADNCQVIAVPDGTKALEALESNHRIDLAVLDLMMPGLTGYEVCRAIRKRYPLSELPVLLLTARSRPEDKLAAFDAGVNDFLSKPVEAGELRARIRTLLSMKTSISELISSEMAFLQAQIKPHFLFNAFSTILSVSYKDIGKAQSLLVELSLFLRHSFDFHNRDKLIPIRQELELVHSYLMIEKARFGDRLRMVMDVEEGLDGQIPPLIIQPLVENAVRHGIMGKVEGGEVRLSMRRDEARLYIAITDDGIGISADVLAHLGDRRHTHSGGGVGLINIERRLRNHYGVGLEIESEQGKGTTIIIRIPNV
ncbi:ATP-binding protein [Paenibacillus sp. J5C_2022]|uniref:ATP-binding protein n=1 Tax=Paenibacillus sp. J5C2022 TaxID=2977129 RepID=UPI0021CE9527|nr:ATP-binding protein [Paenibacillus sp. J5C2022]MCU6708675.1 ATP-binding protein [Paenibacillus sp. J5C2022]